MAVGGDFFSFLKDVQERENFMRLYEVRLGKLNVVSSKHVNGPRTTELPAAGLFSKRFCHKSQANYKIG